MILRFLPALILLWPISCQAGDPPLKVATWNVQNFLLQDQYLEGRYRPDFPMPEDRKKQVRQLILDLRPSLLFLQELGSAAFLTELQLDLAASGLSYPHARFSAADGNRSGLAVLSLFPLQEILFHDPVPLDLPQSTAMRRGIQEVALDIEGQTARFFHVHLKSRYSEDPEDPESAQIRIAELKALQVFLEARLFLQPAAPFVLLGDFNTPFDSPLLDGIRQHWQPLEARDATGQDWTYHHARSGSREVLDGVWLPLNGTPLLRHARLFPAHTGPVPSDHRLVQARP